MGLAVSDDFLVGCNAQVAKDLRHVLANTQVARLVHARRPLEIDGAGYVSAFGCDHFLARILGWRAGIPDRQVGGTQTALQVLARRGRFVVQRQLYRGIGSRRNVSAQR